MSSDQTGRTRPTMVDEPSLFPEYKPPSQRSSSRLHPSPGIRQELQGSLREGSFRQPLPRSTFSRTSGIGRRIPRSQDNVDDQEWDSTGNRLSYDELGEYGEEREVDDSDCWDDHY